MERKIAAKADQEEAEEYARLEAELAAVRAARDSSDL